jgi:hypothetical protein
VACHDATYKKDREREIKRDQGGRERRGREKRVRNGSLVLVDYVTPAVPKAARFRGVAVPGRQWCMSSPGPSLRI